MSDGGATGDSMYLYKSGNQEDHFKHVPMTPCASPITFTHGHVGHCVGPEMIMDRETCESKQCSWEHQPQTATQDAHYSCGCHSESQCVGSGFEWHHATC